MTCRRLKPNFRAMPSTNPSFELGGSLLGSSRAKSVPDVCKRAFQPARKTWLFLVLVFAALISSRAETIILHLKNGDRLAGTIISEDTNRVIITTTWVKELAVPVSEILKREIAPAPATPPVAEQKPPPSAPSTVTNVVPSAKAGTPVVVAATPPKPAPKPKHWKGEVKVGADFISGAKDQQIYYGRFKLTYEHPYAGNPKQFFRNIMDYSVDYGRTEGAPGTNGHTDSVVSANKMDGSDKTDFDFGKQKLFVYNLGAAGYDQIRKIDLHYEIGPGMGYHLLTRTNFVMNSEFGVNYQAQYRSDNTTTEKFYFRLAEDMTWKVNKTLTFTEKFEFFPQVEELSEYRSRFETTLSYGIWQNISLNVSVLDLYDTQPAANVPNNDLQIRSSLGFTF
jgi:putative salt-induced outer membrane protein YdiY